MYYVYILLSLYDKKLYIGSTNNLNNRIKKHQNGFVLSTKYRRPLKLIYVEIYISSIDALRRDRYLKGGKGRQDLRTQLQATYSTVRYPFR
ncbi:MAG: GIY-YIG nuclease family protein [Candidatus Nomurabacteria bacterium]|nr:MAG: GIY-YIG nuclease family protein [Candidatus Nomurabacteria bacterium]